MVPESSVCLHVGLCGGHTPQIARSSSQGSPASAIATLRGPPFRWKVWVQPRPVVQFAGHQNHRASPPPQELDCATSGRGRQTTAQSSPQKKTAKRRLRITRFRSVENRSRYELTTGKSPMFGFHAQSAVVLSYAAMRRTPSLTADIRTSRLSIPDLTRPQPVAREATMSFQRLTPIVPACSFYADAADAPTKMPGLLNRWSGSDLNTRVVPFNVSASNNALSP
jgi:hypothetical protein